MGWGPIPNLVPQDEVCMSWPCFAEGGPGDAAEPPRPPCVKGGEAWKDTGSLVENCFVAKDAEGFPHFSYLPFA